MFRSKTATRKMLRFQKHWVTFLSHSQAQFSSTPAWTWTLFGACTTIWWRILLRSVAETRRYHRCVSFLNSKEAMHDLREFFELKFAEIERYLWWLDKFEPTFLNFYHFSKLERIIETNKIRVTVEIDDKLRFEGSGRSFRLAKATAAKRALKYLHSLEAQRRQNALRV